MTIIPLPPPLVKTRAEYIELAARFAAIGPATDAQEIAYNSMQLQRAQVYATLALSAPSTPLTSTAPTPEYSEALSAVAGVVELLDAIESGLEFIASHALAKDAVLQRTWTLQTLIRAWRGGEAE